MFGIADKSIVISQDEATGYIIDRLKVLTMEKEELLNKLECVNCQIEAEQEKLYGVNNPPVKEECINPFARIMLGKTR